MTISQKKALYESIMKNVAKEVKKALDEKFVPQRNVEPKITAEQLKSLFMEGNIVRHNVKNEWDVITRAHLNDLEELGNIGATEVTAFNRDIRKDLKVISLDPETFQKVIKELQADGYSFKKAVCKNATKKTSAYYLEGSEE